MIKVSLNELLEAGCHFGHQRQRWNPKASQYIYTERDGIHVIDLAKTSDGISRAYEFLKDLAASGGTVIFLGTKRQAKSAVLEGAKKCGAYYLTTRWPGGLFTNWEQIKRNLERVKKLRELTTSEEAKNTYTKREILLFQRELTKMLEVYGGVESLDKIPDAIFIIDCRKESNAVREAVIKGVKIIGMVDTNTDPTDIDYPIPANDDAVGSINLVVKYMTEAVEEGNKVKETKVTEVTEATKEEKQKKKAKKVTKVTKVTEVTEGEK